MDLPTDPTSRAEARPLCRDTDTQRYTSALDTEGWWHRQSGLLSIMWSRAARRVETDRPDRGRGDSAHTSQATCNNRPAKEIPANRRGCTTPSTPLPHIARSG